MDFPEPESRLLLTNHFRSSTHCVTLIAIPLSLMKLSKLAHTRITAVRLVWQADHAQVRTSGFIPFCQTFPYVCDDVARQWTAARPPSLERHCCPIGLHRYFRRFPYQSFIFYSARNDSPPPLACPHLILRRQPMFASVAFLCLSYRFGCDTMRPPNVFVRTPVCRRHCRSLKVG